MHRIPASARSSASSTAAAPLQRPRRQVFEQEAFADCVAFLFERGGEARCHGLAGKIGDQRDAFAGLDRETGFDGVARAEEQLWLCGSKIHPDIVNRVGEFCYWIESQEGAIPD